MKKINNGEEILQLKIIEIFNFCISIIKKECGTSFDEAYKIHKAAWILCFLMERKAEIIYLEKYPKILLDIYNDSVFVYNNMHNPEKKAKLLGEVLEKWVNFQIEDIPIKAPYTLVVKTVYPLAIILSDTAWFYHKRVYGTIDRETYYQINE